MPRVGAHVAAAGGCFTAVQRASETLGPRASALAFFIRPRLTWRPVAAIAEAHVAKFHELLKHSAIRLSHVVVHGSYLLNCGSYDPELRAKSVELMAEEVAKCQQLGVELYVFHPGAATSEKKKKKTKTKKKKKDTEEEGQGVEEEGDEAERRQQAVVWVGECVAEVLRRTTGVTLVLENTCGHGHSLGFSFQELRAMLDASVAAYGDESAARRLGVCLDTCHLFASGWEMATDTACDEMLAAFDARMGPQWADVLKVVHVNDSRDPVGSRRDRHANIGRGCVGMAAFKWLMNCPRLKDLPLILETPRHEKEKSTGKKRKKEEEEEEEEEEEVVGGRSAREEIELLLGLVV